MQRALSHCRLASTSKLAQNREVQIAQLTSLLPHSMQTNLTIDLFSLISRPIHVLIPPTLLHDKRGLFLITSKRFSRFTDFDTAIEEFTLEITKWNTERRVRISPQFVHRTATSHPIFIPTLQEAVSVWKSRSGDQRLQLYVIPATPQATLLRAHWKASKPTAVYYIASSQTSTLNSRKPHLPAIMKRIPELALSQPQSPKYKAKFVDMKSSLTWAVKRTKPIEEIERTLQELVRLVELGITQTRQSIEQLVADFIPDCNKKWVLLSIEGCTFSHAMKPVIENLEQKQTIDLKFILFPLFNQKQALGQRLRDIKRREEGARRLSLLGINHSTTRKSESPIKPPISTIHPEQPSHCHSRKSLKSSQESSFSKIINNYDEMMDNIKRYKQELKGATNFIQRYGGPDFWEVISIRLRNRLRNDSLIGDLFQCLNPEESSSMMRGYQRVLEGNYNMYYKQTLLKIHKNLGITSKQYEAFLNGFEYAVCGQTITAEDCAVIIKRFKMLESCIVVSR